MVFFSETSRDQRMLLKLSKMRNLLMLWMLLMLTWLPSTEESSRFKPESSIDFGGGADGGKGRGRAAASSFKPRSERIGERDSYTR